MERQTGLSSEFPVSVVCVNARAREGESIFLFVAESVRQMAIARTVAISLSGKRRDSEFRMVEIQEMRKITHSQITVSLA